MANPFLPIVLPTGSVSVQNRLDASGTMATYLTIILPTQNGQIQFANTKTPLAVLQLDRTTLGGMTASIANSVASGSTAGSY